MIRAIRAGGTGNGEITIPNAAGFLDDGSFDGFTGGGCNVPYPFSAWTVSPPQFSSLNPSSTETKGGQFTITGQYLYPSSVVAVLIGGTAISLSTNVDLVDDTTIEVVVPTGYVPGTYRVQVNTLFNNETRFSNTLDLTLTD